MAALSSPGLRRGQAIKGSTGMYSVSGKNSNRRGSRGSAVHFDEVTSIYPAGPDENYDPQHQVGFLRREPNEDYYQGAEYEDRVSSKKWCYTCNTLLERPWVGRFFSLCSVLNLLSLACSSPWRVCELESTKDFDECGGVFLQFVIITFVDFVLSIVYTIQLTMATQCILVHFCKDHKKKVRWR